MIEVKNLTKRFGAITAVNEISFTIKAGEITGFLGPNGAGKSTTLKMLSAYLKPTSGDVLYDHKKMSDYEHDIRKDIGYLPELNPLYHELLVYDYLKYMALLKEIPKKEINERIHYVAQRCGIIDRLPQMIGTLSKGYKQRVGLAQAILSDPKILILDEPTNGLDPNQIIEIRSLICELGKDRTVILSSHILQEIQAICQRILIIHKGKIITDANKDDLLETQNLEEVFTRLTGCHVEERNISEIPPLRSALGQNDKNCVQKDNCHVEERKISEILHAVQDDKN